MPELTFIHYAIVSAAVFTAGFIDAIAGGGGLITLPTYLLVGLPPHNAISTNKLSSAMGTTISLFLQPYLQRSFWKNSIPRKTRVGFPYGLFKDVVSSAPEIPEYFPIRVKESVVHSHVFCNEFNKRN